jgi:glucuronoarabinoxylan endo-1,4-beta-xylanase
VLFVRSRDRQASNMKGSSVRFDRLDDMATTKSTFGTTYKMSGKSKKFDHSNPLISTRTAISSGYIELGNRFDKLVMEVKKVTSTMNYSSSKTTLLYVNSQGQLASHDYGSIDFSRRENFNLEFDLSPLTLTDGCRGLVSLTNDNWSSTLTITFGDVYLSNGSGTYAATLSGEYVADDSNVLDYSTDDACTSINMTAVTQLPSLLPWLESTNHVVYVSEGTPLTGANIVVGSTCSSLSLNEDYGSFRPLTPFTAETATFVCTVNGVRLLSLPFNAAVPDGVEAYTLTNELKAEPVTSITRHEPVLIVGQGKVTFTDNGEVSYAVSDQSSLLHTVYTPMPLYAGDYVLRQQDGTWSLKRLNATTSLLPFDAYASPASSAEFLPIDITLDGIHNVFASRNAALPYNLMGQKVDATHRGIIIRGGKKYMKR